MNIKHYLFALALMPTFVSANDSNPDTTTNPGLTVTWTFSVNPGDNTATITGATPLDVLSGDIAIPEIITDGGGSYTVASITGANSNSINGIQNNLNISSVSFPPSITYIGSFAFYGCTGLTGALDLPSGLDSIGNSAFQNCGGLTGSLTIPDGVTTIDTYAFSGCSGFNGALTIPASVTSIGTYAFSGCSKFTGTLTIPDGVTSIEAYTFSNCSGFTGPLTIPDGVTFIGAYAFSSCSGFTGPLTIPDGVTSIGYRSFFSCRGLTSLDLPSGLNTINTGAFRNCSGFTGDLDLSSQTNLVTIGARAFANCGFDGVIKFPNTASFTTIGSGAFHGDAGFKNNNLVIPASVTSLGTGTDTNATGVFGGCTGLTGDVTVEGATTLNPALFSMCTGLRSVTFKSPTLTIASAASVNDGSFFGATNLEYIDMSYSDLTSFNTQTIQPTPRSMPCVFGGCPSHTLIYMPKQLPQFSTTEPNFISSDIWNSDWISVTDQADYFIPHAITSVGKMTYDNYSNSAYDITTPQPRVFTNNLDGADDKDSDFSTLYLPYDFELPAGMVAYKLVRYDDYNVAFKGPSFMFKSVAGKLSANTPYIAHFESSSVASASLPPMLAGAVLASPVGVNHVVDGVAIPMPNAIQSTQNTSGDGSFSFFGSTEDVDNATAAGWNAYNLMPDMAWHPIKAEESSGYIGHMRCFIVANGTSAAKPSMIRIAGIPGFDTPTSISDIFGNSEPANGVETRIYDMGGRYLGKDINVLPKGLYVVNGKKVVKD